jgi:hypothetical protein
MDVFVDRRDLQYCSMDTDSAVTQDAVVKPNTSPKNTFGSPVPTLPNTPPTIRGLPVCLRRNIAGMELSPFAAKRKKNKNPREVTVNMFG